MPLPAPELDDRKFQDIVDEAKRLIPRFCPEWTNHNVSDPGVALIELFAWMSEMVLYRVNQVPERLYVHFLNMVGIEPFPPSVARVDLTFWLSAVLEAPVVVPANTQVMTAAGASSGGVDAVIFSTVKDLTIAPPELKAAKAATEADDRIIDVWDDLRYDQTGVQTLPICAVDSWRRVPARVRRQPGRRRAAVDARGARRGHRRRPAHAADRVGGVERRGVDQRTRLPGHDRRPEPGRADRAADSDRARAAGRRQRVGVLAAGAACSHRCLASPPIRPRRACVRSRRMLSVAR